MKMKFYDKNETLLLEINKVEIINIDIIINEKQNSIFNLIFEDKLIEPKTLIKICNEDKLILKLIDDHLNEFLIHIEKINNINLLENTGDSIKPQQKCINILTITANINIFPIKYNEKAEVEITLHEECNMDCEYCYQKAFHYLSLDETKLYFNEIYKCVESYGLSNYLLMGGEITKRIDKFNIAVELFDKYNLDENNDVTKIFTNGTVYSKELSDYILSNDKRELWITIDTVIAQHDKRHINIAEVKNNIKQYIEDGIDATRILILLVVTNDTIDDIEVTIENLYLHGLKNFRFKCENSINEDLQNIEFEKSDFLIKYNNILNNIINKYNDIILFRNSPTSPCIQVNYRYKDENENMMQLANIILLEDKNKINSRIENVLPISNKLYDCNRKILPKLIDLR